MKFRALRHLLLAAVFAWASAATLMAQRDPIAHVLLGAPELAVVAAVRAADDERVAATLAADRARLASIYSDQLHYAHSNGTVDSKASFIESLTSGRTDYQAIDYPEREFLPIAPGVVLMKGRAMIRLGGAETSRLIDLNYLAVWRQEDGRWKFLAWQSCRNPGTAL